MPDEYYIEDAAADMLKLLKAILPYLQDGEEIGGMTRGVMAKMVEDTIKKAEGAIEL